jgi:hypothetical protein
MEQCEDTHRKEMSKRPDRGTCTTPVVGTAFHIWRSIASIDAMADTLSGDAIFSKLPWTDARVSGRRMLSDDGTKARQACVCCVVVCMNMFTSSQKGHRYGALLTKIVCLRI